MDASTKRYWFKPARFWGWFAAYYPVSWEGWIVWVLALAAFVSAFRCVDLRSHSVSDTLIGFAPWFIGISLAVDLVMRWKGEYPWWWRRGSWKKEENRSGA